MTVRLPLEQMTLAEKLEVMETLWADLSRRADELPSPAWHERILEEREREVGQGKARFLDWDEAIAGLRKEVDADSAP